MAQLETWIRQDLKKPLQVQYLSGTMFSQDNAANLVGVEVFDDGEPATLGGSVSANVVRSDGGTVAVSTGTVSGNKVSVVLPQAAYAIPGQISIIIKLTAGGTVTTLGAIVVTVYRSSTDAVVDPGTIIPSVQNLISQIETAVASIPADYSSLWTSLAPAFSSSTAYTAGQYVTYNGHLYRFTANHAAGSFVNTDCTQVDVGSELSSLKSAISETNYDLAPYTGKFVITPTYINRNIKESDGTLEVGNNWYASDYIKCEPGQSIIFKSRNGNHNALYTDKSEAAYVGPLSYGTTVVPDGVYYFRVSVPKNVYDTYGFGITTLQSGFDIAVTGTDDTISTAAKWAAFSNDMDNLQVNKIYQIMYNQGIAHLPDSNYFGTVITFEYNANAGTKTTVQLAFARYGKTYRRMKWGSSWGDWNEFSFVGDGKSVQSLGITLGTASAWETYSSDANNLPVNSIVAVGYRTGIANLPGDVACIIVTNSVMEGSDSQFVAQYAFAPIENAFYFRAKWSTWRAWQKIAENNFIAGSGLAIVNANGWAAFDNDFNNLTVNKIYQILYTTDIANSPYEGFTGSLISFDYSPTAASKTNVQMAFARNGRVLRRMMWGTSWGEWYEMALKSDIPDVSNIPINTAYKGLGDFIACGDSNTVSLSYPTSSAGIPVKSWATSLAQMIGSNCTIYAAGGRSTAGFISSADYAPAIADTKQFAILYLGINDCSQSVEIETFTANYTTIVNALLTNHKFVFCLNIPAAVQPSSRRTQYNTAIESVCSSIQKAFLVDITGCSDRIAVYKNVGHLSSIGYAVLAGEIAQAINKTMSENDYFDSQIDTDSAT